MSLSGRLSSLFGGRRHAGSSPPAPDYGPIRGSTVAEVGHVSFHGPSLTARQLWVVVAVAIAVLGVLVAADVGAYESAQGISHITTVNWYAAGGFLSSETGFSVHASSTFTLTLTCNSICYNFNGATVSAPFQVVGFSLVNQPIQYTNVTVRAPASAYTGPMSITLGLP